MGLFDINDEKLQALYHRALVEANYGIFFLMNVKEVLIWTGIYGLTV